MLADIAAGLGICLLPMRIAQFIVGGEAAGHRNGASRGRRLSYRTVFMKI
jgi:hypothetical protein